MINTCCVVNCTTGYKKRCKQQVLIPQKLAVFKFPKDNPELFEKWI